MRKIFIKFIILLLSVNLCAQDITINLSKSGGIISETVENKTKNANGDYEISAVSGFKITITKNFSESYTVKITNQTAPGGNPMGLITVSENNRLIVIGADGKIAGGAGIVLSSSFRFLIDGTLKVNFKVTGDSDTGDPVPLAPIFKPAGISFWDAKKLIDEINTPTTDNSTILDILSYYTSISDTKINLKTWQEAKDFYINNSFILAYIKFAENIVGDIRGAQSGNATKNMLSSVASGIGGLDVTNIADGFAKFIVKRAKQELSIAFFDKFKAEIKKYPDLQTVFPQTYKALSAIDQEIYNYTAYIQTLRESFEKDLATLPSNLPSIIDNHEEFFDNLPEVKAILQTGFYIAQQIQDKQHPGSIIENYPIEFLDNAGINSNIKASFETFKLLSVSLKANTETDSYWASYSEIRKLFSLNDDMLLKTYLGLLEQQAKLQSITFKDGGGTVHELSKIIDASYGIVGDLARYKTYFKNLVLKIQSIEIKVAGLKTITNDSLKFENYYGFVSASIDLMKYLTQVENLPRFPQDLHIQKKTAIYFYIAQTSADIVIDVNRRNYSSAIVNVIQIYDTIFNKKNNEDLIAKTYSPGAGLTDSEKEKEKAEQVKGRRDSARHIIKAVFKYGSFMATIVTAKSSDEVEETIEAFALPVGSSRIKRTTAFNVALNAYAGFFYGHEYIPGIKDKLAFNSYGVTAPVGISISIGQRQLFNPFSSKGHASYSLFISLVDIGAVASYRVNNDTVAQVPTIQLKDIFSPGAFLSIGIPKTPLSLNLGAQVGPNLRKVKNSQNDYADKTYTRLSVSLCVDIPIFNFYTKSESN